MENAAKKAAGYGPVTNGNGVDELHELADGNEAADSAAQYEAETERGESRLCRLCSLLAALLLLGMELYALWRTYAAFFPRPVLQSLPVLRVGNESRLLPPLLLPGFGARDVLIITVDTAVDNREACMALGSAVRQGYYAVFIQLPPFSGGKELGLARKPLPILRFLQQEANSSLNSTLNPRLYMFVDSRDVIFQRGPQELYRRWTAEGRPPMVISTEAHSYPHEFIERYPLPPEPEPDRIGFFVNSGQWLGSLDGVLHFLTQYEPHLGRPPCVGMNDQCVFTAMMFDSNMTLARLDRSFSFMASMYPPHDDDALNTTLVRNAWLIYDFDNNSCLHRIDNVTARYSSPISVHYNGPSKALSWPRELHDEQHMGGKQMDYLRERQWQRTDLPPVTVDRFLAHVTVIDAEGNKLDASGLARLCTDFR